MVILHRCASSFAEVQAVLLSDMLVFLQEKDQKYVFASLVRLQPFFPLIFLCERPVMLCCVVQQSQQLPAKQLNFLAWNIFVC